MHLFKLAVLMKEGFAVGPLCSAGGDVAMQMQTYGQNS